MEAAYDLHQEKEASRYSMARLLPLFHFWRMEASLYPSGAIRGQMSGCEPRVAKNKNVKFFESSQLTAAN